MITAAPTLCSVMNAAASRRVRPGVIVNTLSDIASRTFTAAPLESGSLVPIATIPVGGPVMLARMRAERFPVGASATIEELEGSPHALLARLREREPVSWLPAIDGWLVTRRDLALAAMRDAGGLHGPGPALHDRAGRRPEHALARRARARPPPRAVRRAAAPGRGARDARRTPCARRPTLLLDALEPAGEAELRRGFAGPLAAAVVTRALGLSHADVDAVLGHYDAIVGAVSDLSAGRPARPEAAEAVASLGRSGALAARRPPATSPSTSTSPTPP